MAAKSAGEGRGSEFVVRVPALPDTVVRSDRHSAVVTPWNDGTLKPGPLAPTTRTAT